MTLASITKAMHDLARDTLWERHGSRVGVQYVPVVDPQSLRLDASSVDTTVPETCMTIRVVLTAWQWEATGKVAGYWVCLNPVETETDLGG